jgi:broad specificity phosphatase PhoE
VIARRFLLLVRHAAAEKNARLEFAGDESSDCLTEEGETQVLRLINEVTLFQNTLSIDCTAIFHADSGRARATALPLATSLETDHIQLAGFRSIQAGIAAGMREQDLWSEHRDFAVALHLYRAGLVSSYDIPYPEGAESVTEFEAVVEQALSVLLDNSQGGLSIVVGHRSSITASLLYFARRFHNYPRDFFGFVPLEPGLSSCVELTPDHCQIRWVNKHIDSTVVTSVTKSRD